MIRQEILDKIYNETLKKPEYFHHVCYGGSSMKMVDQYSKDKNFTCRYKGEKNWMTPVCEKCTGLTSEYQTLTEYARTYNYGMERLYNALSFAIKNESDLLEKYIQYIKDCEGTDFISPINGRDSSDVGFSDDEWNILKEISEGSKK